MIEFELNGESVASASEADTPLLWVVRDELKLKGTKYGCGIAMVAERSRNILEIDAEQSVESIVAECMAHIA